MVGETAGQEKYNVIEASVYRANRNEEGCDIEKGDFVKFSSKGKEYQGIILDLSTRIPTIGGPRSPEEEFETNFFHATLSKATSFNARILIISHRTDNLKSGTDGSLISPYLAIRKLDKNEVMEVITATDFDFLFTATQVINTVDLADLIVRVYTKIKGSADGVEARFRTKAVEALMFANVELDSGFLGEFVKEISDSHIKGVVLGQTGNILEILPLDGNLRMGDLLIIRSKKGDFVAQVDEFRTDKIAVRGLEKKEEHGDYTSFVDQIERGAVLTGITSDFMTSFVHTPGTLQNPIPIGRFYYGGEAYLGLHTLGRQGMLIVGGVGQKKTASLLSIIENTIEKTENLSFVIVDLNDEYGTDDLIRLSRDKKGFLKIPVEMLKEHSAISIDDFDEFCMKHGLKGNSKADHRRQFVGAAYGYESEGNSIELSKPCFIEIAEKIYNKEKELDVLSWINELPDGIFETTGQLEIEEVIKSIRDNTVTIIDCSSKLASNQKGVMYSKCFSLFKALLEVAQSKERFACVLVIDEAHFFVPQTSIFRPVGFKAEVKKILQEIATIGPRNLLAPWVSTQRLAAVNKTLSTQMGQNILAFNLEDIDKNRLEEIVGRHIRNVEKLNPGECWVKSLSLKTPQIVKINIRDYPKSGETSFVKESGFICE